MGIWDDVKSGNLPKNDNAQSAWKNVKQDRITESDLLSPSTNVSNTVIKTNNIFPVGTIAFDLETGSVDDLFRTGSEYIRLIGYSVDSGETVISIEAKELIKQFNSNEGWIVSHNGLNFDLIALARHTNLDILDLARNNRILDTKLCAFLADPPVSRTPEREIERMFSLDNTGLRYLGEGKVKDIVTGKSVLKELAKEFGGFDKIPQDHPKYIEYLEQDVVVTRDLARVIPINDYAIREHKINAIASTISIQGFRVDVDLLEQRIQEGEEKRLAILTALQGYGLPSPDSTKAPHRTKAGITAIDQAFNELGVTLPRTEKTGRPALGKEVLLGVVESSENQNVIDLAESVLSLNGIRTIYGNIQDHLVGDRVHPSINLRQSSGRWSIQKPGLTVIGKRGGKVIERAVFLPDDPTHVLISCDLSQVDARSVAGLSQDVEYMKLFEPGKDAHSEIAERVFGSRDKRELAKPVVHGWSYGMQPYKLSLTTALSLEEAEEFDAEMQRKFPTLVDWQRRVREEGEVKGLLYNGFGRLMRVEPERAFTQAPALMGQSTARDILCEGILRLWDMGGDDVIRMIRAVIHDEVVLSVPLKDADELEKLVVKALSFEWCPVGGNYSVNIEAGIGSRGNDWSRCYDK